jgi:hypothetical protein
MGSIIVMFVIFDVEQVVSAFFIKFNLELSLKLQLMCNLSVKVKLNDIESHGQWMRCGAPGGTRP